MNKEIIMGIDPSINSIGISINNSNKKYNFFIILPNSKMTRNNIKWNERFAEEKCLKYISYDKTDIGTAITYHEKESIKLNNFINIINIIKYLINNYKPTKIQMEGIAYGSSGTLSVIDLAGLNYMIRLLCVQNNIPFYIVSPSELKKYATGMGNANKDLMVAGFLMLFDEFKDIKKIDDVADAYYLSNFKEHYHSDYKNIDLVNI